ncbi:hypothetical protein T439DRAFT_353470 [Meredithblackwellia eburnea MCA 4105]
MLAGRATGGPWVTTTSSNFTTNLIFAAAETQVVLASIPLLALGFAGFALAGFQISISRVNRAFLDLALAVLSAFAAGVLQLFNVLQCELQGRSSMGHPLLVAQGIGIATFITFTFFFLFRRTQHPFMGERPRAQLPEPSTTPHGGRRGNFKVGFRGGRSPVMHSGSYDRYGVLGGIVRLAVFLTIFIVGLLEAIWRLGFISNPSMFIGVYRASSGLQVTLELFFIAKLAESYITVKKTHKLCSISQITPLLFGLVLAFVVSVTNLVPRLRGFSESPLGRFLIFLEYTYLLVMVIQDHQQPYRDSFSFDQPNATNTDTLKDSLLFDIDEKGRSSSQFGANSPAPSEPPALPERIKSLVQAAAPPSTSRSRGLEFSQQLLQPESPAYDFEQYSSGEISSSSPKTTAMPISTESEGMLAEEGSISVDENDRITFRGAAFTIPQYEPVGTSQASSSDQETPILLKGAARERNREDRNRRPSDLPPVSQAQARGPGRKPSIISIAPSVATFDAKGIRLSSPNLDLQFSIYGSLTKQQKEHNAMHKAAAVRSTLNRAPSNTRLDRLSSEPPLRSEKRPLAANTEGRARGLSRPGPTPLQGGAIMTSSSDDLIARPEREKESSDPSRHSEMSLATNESAISLSNFPEPPPALRSRLLPPIIPIPPRPSTVATTSTSSSRATNIVTEGGVEFEVLPPRPVTLLDGTRDSLESATGTTYDVTSLIVGDRRTLSQLQQDQNLRPISEGQSDSSVDPFSPLPVSPASSELVEIRREQVLRSASGSRTKSPLASGARPYSPEQHQPQEVLQKLPETSFQKNFLAGSKPTFHRRKESQVNVADVGRFIPPRADQDADRRSSPTFSGPKGIIGLPLNPRKGVGSPASSGQASSADASSNSSTSPTGTLTQFNSATSTSSPSTSASSYDPRRPFEKPRPAPLVLIPEGSEAALPVAVQPGGVGLRLSQRPASLAKATTMKRSRSRGGRKMDIVVMRDVEE